MPISDERGRVMPAPLTPPPACGMCARLCWQCEQRFDRLKAEWERQGERVAGFEAAFAQAIDDEREEISERLQDAIELWWQMGEELEEFGQ